MILIPIHPILNSQKTNLSLCSLLISLSLSILDFIIETPTLLLSAVTKNGLSNKMTLLCDFSLIITYLNLELIEEFWIQINPL